MFQCKFCEWKKEKIKLKKFTSEILLKRSSTSLGGEKETKWKHAQ